VPSQALRCARSRSAEAARRCALLWSSENAAGAKRDRRQQVRGAGGVARRDLPGLALASALSAAPPYPLSFFEEFIPSLAPLVLTPAQGLATPPSQLSLGLHSCPGTGAIRVARREGGRIPGKGRWHYTPGKGDPD
jgi:hypothetical protein